MNRWTVTEEPATRVLERDASEWDALAAAHGSPFLSVAWLRAWTACFAPSAVCLTARDEGGVLRASTCVDVKRGLRAAANVETGDWTVCGSDASARTAVWDHLARRGTGRVTLAALPDDDGGEEACAALRRAGYLLTTRESLDSPRLLLPPTWSSLLEGASRNLRGQYRRRSRALQQLGPVTLRTSSDVSDLAAFLDLEARGWKDRRGTAITSRPATQRLYERFAREAAVQGWLRLQLLHAGGRLVAADLSCAYGGGVFMLKTAYDEDLAAMSPGLVLRGRALASAIEDGCGFYDFLGGAEPYKLRWGATPRRHLTVHAHRLPLGVLPHGYHAALRPRLKRARDWLLSSRRGSVRTAARQSDGS